MAAASPAPLLSAPPEPAATVQSAANTKAAHQARRIQWRREGGRNCRFNIPGPHCGEPIPQLIAIRRAKSTSTWVATAGEPKLWPKCFSTAHPGARPGAHRPGPKRTRQPPANTCTILMDCAAASHARRAPRCRSRSNRARIQARNTPFASQATTTAASPAAASPRRAPPVVGPGWPRPA